jgi:hypothetical protein
MSPTPPSRDQLISLARAAAAAHSLDPALVCAVVEQESAWNPFAIRYEPGFLARYVAPLFTTGKISATEAYARSFSWGLMQVMGQVAREHGFGAPPSSSSVLGAPHAVFARGNVSHNSETASLAALCDPATGLDVGCRVLAHKFATASPHQQSAVIPSAARDLLSPSGSSGAPCSPEQANVWSFSCACGNAACPLSGGVSDSRAVVGVSSTDPHIIERALQLWNGGANPDYAAQVLARMKNYL